MAALLASTRARRPALLVAVTTALLAVTMFGSVTDADTHSKNAATHPPEAFFVNGQRPPGSLLLTMLIKDEREHLLRTLPQWKPVISAYVIGVDDKNTDDSIQVIKRALAGVPGHIEIVKFDGMGPTWSVLTRKGWELYPNCTHGIISDADFAPVAGTMDYNELDIRYAKCLFSVRSEDGSVRKIDWIYRNMPGVWVDRRTHQSVRVPDMVGTPGAGLREMHFQVTERTGGYQDRTGGAEGKARRYAEFLEADLKDYPGDPRTLYYLGIAYEDRYKAAIDKSTPEALAFLDTSREYFQKRVQAAGTMQAQPEESWFACLKLGELHERYYRDFDTAIHWYDEMKRLDPDRADGFFHSGQAKRLSGRPGDAIEDLVTASSLPMPDRSHFNWVGLYKCIAPVELARAFAAMDEITAEHVIPLKVVVKRLKDAQKGCTDAFPEERELSYSYLPEMEAKLALARSLKRGTSQPTSTPAATKSAEPVEPGMHAPLDVPVLSFSDLQTGLPVERKFSSVPTLPSAARTLVAEAVQTLKAVEGVDEQVLGHAVSEIEDKISGASATCRDYRRAVTSFIKNIEGVSKFAGQVAAVRTQLMTVCW